MFLSHIRFHYYNITLIHAFFIISIRLSLFTITFIFHICFFRVISLYYILNIEYIGYILIIFSLRSFFAAFIFHLFSRNRYIISFTISRHISYTHTVFIDNSHTRSHKSRSLLSQYATHTTDTTSLVQLLIPRGYHCVAAITIHEDTNIDTKSYITISQTYTRAR